jgi:hypothetical protein
VCLRTAVPQLLQALDELDAESSQDSCAARQRLASFLGTLFVKNEVSGTDETVLRAVAARRPHLQGQYLYSIYFFTE